jgi:hypothetical protein
MYNKNIRVHLIDTPGFDDTDRSDVQVLVFQSLAAFTSSTKTTKSSSLPTAVEAAEEIVEGLKKRIDRPGHEWTDTV